MPFSLYEKRLKATLEKFGEIKDDSRNKQFKQPTRAISIKNHVQQQDNQDDLDGFQMIVLQSYQTSKGNIATKCVNCFENFQNDFPDGEADNFSEDIFTNYKFLYNYNRNRNKKLFWRWSGIKFVTKLHTEDIYSIPFPIFTYCLVFIELLIMFLLFSFDFAPTLNRQEISNEQVWYQTGSYKTATYYKHPNIWFGPEYVDLISEGAKFTPCMRKDKTIEKKIETLKLLENNSGCCIRNDLTGCVQSIESKCSNKTSFWIKWSNKPGPVCGLDPEYCLQFQNGYFKEANQNITNWPICLKNNNEKISTSSNNLHMKCRVQARPCCIGIYGKCILATKDYCQFIKGTYHPEANLCSQIDCMNDVCGLWYPDYIYHQLYRLVLPIFVHAGIIQLFISLFIQFFYMRPLEQLLGKWRIIVLYFTSGIGGNLASAVFMPFTPDVGPHASLIGLFAFLIHEMLSQRSLNYKKPWLVIFKLIAILLFLLIPGLFLPFVDFYSIIFGMIYGEFIMIIIHPLDKSIKLKFFAAIILFSLTTFLIYLLYDDNDFLRHHQPYLNKLNCLLPSIINCSDIDVAYKEIGALN